MKVLASGEVNGFEKGLICSGAAGAREGTRAEKGREVPEGEFRAKKRTFKGREVNWGERSRGGGSLSKS